MSSRANIPLDEQWRLASERWVDADAAARLLEETKTAVLSQRMKALGDIPAAHSEREVKASPEWAEFIRQMVDARTDANKAKVEMEFLRMRWTERQSENANKRAEMRLTGAA